MYMFPLLAHICVTAIARRDKGQKTLILRMFLVSDTINNTEDGFKLSIQRK